ncbi:MAG: 30S ribosomal protein S6 [Thermomicrobiales bacterium]
MREAPASRFYELMVITTPDGTPEEVLATVDQINGYIATAGGSILRSSSDSPWGRRRLAYPIRHQSHDVRDGFYTLIHFEIAPSQVIEIERDLKLNDRLMRYMVIQLAAEPVFPEPVEEDAEGAPAAEGEVSPVEQEAPADASESNDSAEVPASETASEPSEGTAEDRRVAETAPEVSEAEVMTEVVAEEPAETASAESKE